MVDDVYERNFMDKLFSLGILAICFMALHTEV